MSGKKAKGAAAAAEARRTPRKRDEVDLAAPSSDPPALDDETTLKVVKASASPPTPAVANQPEPQTVDGPAWVDSDEEDLRGPAAVRAQMQPEWASTAAADNKRRRGGQQDELDEGLQDLLSRAVPLVRRTAHQRQLTAPKPASTILLPKGGLKDIAWHPSGEVLVMAATNTIETVHCAGAFVERLASHKMAGRVASVVVTPDGESAVVLPERANVPITMNLRTGKVTPLHFLDTRTSTAYQSVAKGAKIDQPPRLIVMKPGDHRRQLFAMAVGASLHLGSLTDAAVTQKLSLPGPIEDVVFTGDHSMAVAVMNKVFIFDARQSAKYVRSFEDEGSLKANRLCYQAGVLCVGSTSGTVNAYVGESPTPARTFMNLSASVDLMTAGEGLAGPSMVMGSSVQSNGFRFVNLTSMTVAASFPDVAMSHGFVQCVAFNPATSVFAVGEANRVVNYAC